jgi:predicted RecA/RadA family phage recombinase
MEREREWSGSGSGSVKLEEEVGKDWKSGVEAFWARSLEQNVEVGTVKPAGSVWKPSGIIS